MPPACKHGANVFIELYFHDCIYTTRDMVGFSLGLASIGFWMVAQIPQLVANYRRKRADALSPWFLAEWLLGDTLNLLGCLLKGDQLPTVVFTAQYFICMDTVLLIQYMYYRTLQRRHERTFVHRTRRRRHWRPEGEGRSGAGPSTDGHALSTGSKGRHARSAVAAVATLATVAVVARRSNPGAGPDAALRVNSGHQSRRLLGGASLAHPAAGHAVVTSLLLLGNHLPEWARGVGVAMGYGSCVLYLLSRVSQLYRTAVRRSAEGLALSMFFVAVAANVTYGGSILVRAHDWGEVDASLPWLIGSLGTVALDVAILLQALAYGSVLEKPAHEREAGTAEAPAEAEGLQEPFLAAVE